jgi:hypothetical protein
VNVECVLSKLARTSGDEGIPFWVYKESASDIAPIITVLINYSLSKSIVPKQWRHAVVTPIPKTSVISGMNDLRPISVTSLLSRVTERLFIRKYVMPYIDFAVFLNQYAFKPTGSTTCGTVDITHLLLISHTEFLCYLNLIDIFDA